MIILAIQSREWYSVDFYMNLLANFWFTVMVFDGKKMNAFLTPLMIFGMVKKIIIPKVASELVVLTVVVSDAVIQRKYTGN